MSSQSVLTALSNELADRVAAAAPSVVQIAGRRRPASGIVFRENVVVTSVRALGREDGIQVRRADGTLIAAELGGWDPATGIAVLRADGLATPALNASTSHVRIGEIVTALARSWSNNITASTGTVAVIGGPLATGRRRAIDEVIRITAPMHEGFAGGALVGADGSCAGMTTAAVIRGFGVVIPSAIVWKTATALLEHGSMKRGYLGIAGQRVQLPEAQRSGDGPTHALLVVDVTAGSPAATAGLLVGDLLLDFDGHAVSSSEDLLMLLEGDRVGRTVPATVLRGTARTVLNVHVGERPAR